MTEFHLSRRGLLKGASASLATLAVPTLSISGTAHAATIAAPQEEQQPPQTEEQKKRMAWWHAAKFGMFIHFGLYSAHARHEWAMEEEAIPIEEYQQFTKIFHPKPGSAVAWAKLARSAGMKYVVLTTKHHEGFCNWDTKLTNYNAVQQGPRHDIIKEYVEAVRSEGLRVGFYYSLMDWHHPDGARCAHDEEARKRFVEYTHGLVRELMTNYGKIDILWYDVAWPLSAEGWESERLNKMVMQLQPEIIYNNRNKTPGDFSTPEQRIVAAKGGRAWEACMTLNDSWGYQAADDNWKPAKTVVRNLISCARDGGNYLLNIGPRGVDGSIPEPSVDILTEVGKWMQKNGECIYQSDICQVTRSTYATFTRAGNTLHMHVYFWPGSDVAISGLKTKVLSAKMFVSGQPVKFTQDEFRVHITGLPEKAPDSPVTTISLDCEAEPVQDTDFVRINKPRAGVGI